MGIWKVHESYVAVSYTALTVTLNGDAPRMEASLIVAITKLLRVYTSPSVTIYHRILRLFYL